MLCVLRAERRLRAVSAIIVDSRPGEPCFTAGSERIRLAVAVKIALQIAGTTGGRAGSPRPLGGYSDLTKSTTIAAGA